MFLHVSLILFTGGGGLCQKDQSPGQRPSWTETLLDRDLLDRDSPLQTPPDREPPDRDHPWTETPSPWTETLLDRDTPSNRDDPIQYWNAFLLIFVFTHIFLSTIHLSFSVSSREPGNMQS